MKKIWLWLFLMIILASGLKAEEYINGVASTEIIKQQVQQIEVLSQQVAQVTVVVTNIVTQPVTNFSTMATPHPIVQTGVSNDIDISTYNYQSLVATSAAGIYMPNGVTTVSYNVTIDLKASTNSITIGTNNVLFTTNDVLGVGAAGITIKTNGMITTLLFTKPMYMAYWRLFGI